MSRHIILVVQVFADPPVKIISVCTPILDSHRNINTLKTVLIWLVHMLFGLLQLQTKMFARSSVMLLIKKLDQDEVRLFRRNTTRTYILSHLLDRFNFTD